MSININSEASCRKAYLNYHCYGNSMNISTAEMSEITTRWESNIKSWQMAVSQDENQYEFDDSDYSSYKEKGRKIASEETNHSGNDSKNIINSSASSAGGAVSATFGIIGAVKSGTNIISGLKGAFSTSYSAGTRVSVVGDEVVTQNTTNFSKAAGGSIEGEAGVDGGQGKGPDACAYIAAGLAIATAAMYRIMKPNQVEKKACDDLQNVMANNQTALLDTQADMENMSSELIELSDEANEANEKANDDIECEKTEYDMYKASYEVLKTKAQGGTTLTEDERSLYQELAVNMTEKGTLINEAQESATDTVGEIYDDMGTYQEGYNYAAETMGEVEGSTDFAQGIDSGTQKACYFEAASQGLNAVSGAVAGAQLMGMGFWNWALGIASIAAGVSSGIGAAEQIKMAGEVGTEIDLREDTQTFNTETKDIYAAEVDSYDGFMQGVEALEIELPDDVAPPEDTSLPVTARDGYPAGTPDAIKPKVEK